ncbi:Fic family protein [Novosphingobium sp. G106]|uniref:Fic family protein n=1 Tax=Novosphingobium sp. G106 TaxID=2849500 RepID=UPI001C2D7FC3|nr:Fic family protein [Novosphingobium sp. G106]MBV1692063.1 Fic family protein [Novosphingobium sp. G106]
MQSDILWLTFEDVSRLHEISLEKFGGAAGFKDESAVHSVLNAPQDRAYYNGEDDLLALGIVLLGTGWSFAPSAVDFTYGQLASRSRRKGTITCFQG